MKANAFHQIVTNVNSIGAVIIILTDKWMKEKHADSLSDYLRLHLPA